MLAFVTAGCGGGSLPGPSGGFATTPGQSVLTSAVVKVTLTSKGGGFNLPEPAGAACDAAVWAYTISFDTSEIAFDGCRLNGDQSLAESYVPWMNHFPITGPQLETLTAAVHAITVSANRQCGADANYVELTVESASGSLTYGDDFYGCLTTYDQFVTSDGVNNLAGVLFGIGN